MEQHNGSTYMDVYCLHLSSIFKTTGIHLMLVIGFKMYLREAIMYQYTAPLCLTILWDSSTHSHNIDWHKEAEVYYTIK